MRFLFFVGTAGSGKSTLVQAYKEWLDNADISSIIVNLDPGSDATPYEPDIDIRDWISLGSVMQQYNLGPNGAQVVAADLLTANIGRLTDALAMEDAKYVLIDTPGQLELFAFRQSSIDLVEALGMDKSMIIYTAD
ncbi:MAG: ATP/GTP-binding protein, partial [Candidatus Methanomethylophilaceae archaeon]|nr:ATP/GTP-binding protein [Candidatus Methanomethylophilaceae archaeon]